jgi:hypothetical protein
MKIVWCLLMFFLSCRAMDECVQMKEMHDALQYDARRDTEQLCKLQKDLNSRTYFSEPVVNGFKIGFGAGLTGFFGHLSWTFFEEGLKCWHWEEARGAFLWSGGLLMLAGYVAKEVIYNQGMNPEYYKLSCEKRKREESLKMKQFQLKLLEERIKSECSSD